MANHSEKQSKPGIAKSTRWLIGIAGVIVVIVGGWMAVCFWQFGSVDGFFQWALELFLQARYNRIVAGQPTWPWAFWIFLFSFVAVLVIVLLVVLYLTLLERKLIGWFQIRQGPNRVGPWGLLQPFADMVKLLIKEDIVPYKADHALHLLAPLIIFIPTLLAFATIPFASGTVELPQEIVSPSFDRLILEWIGPDDIEARGFPSPGFLEAAVGIEEDEGAHKTFWVERELDHAPIFIPTDSNGEISDNDENKIRYRNLFPLIHQIKPEVSGPSEPVYATYITAVDFGTSGKAYDILELDWGGSGHNGILELGLQGETIDRIESEFSEILTSTGPDVPPGEQFNFGNLIPKAYLENLGNKYAESVGINSRSFDAASMIPAFARASGQRAVSRDIYTPDWKNVCWMHNQVDMTTGKSNLIFTPEDFNIENDDWRTASGTFMLERIAGGGYIIELPDGSLQTLAAAGDTAQVTIGDKPVTLSLKDSQYYTIYVMGADLGAGILYILAVTSIAVLGIFMAGFGSNNKWSLYGAIRSAAQIISYEIPMTLAVLGPVLMAGSLSVVDLVESQRSVWFVIPQFLAFYVFLVTMTSEVNRSPFDLPEAESELVAGFHTEYSGLKFGFFFLAEYANMFLAAAIMTVLFFGGWKGFFQIPIIGEFLSSFVWFFAKCFFWMCVFIWFRATFPRFRIDHMMDYAWKVLLPIAMINVIITGYFAFSDYNFTIWAENNWRIYDSYIYPMFFDQFVSLYAIPILSIIWILVVSDLWSRWLPRGPRNIGIFMGWLVFGAIIWTIFPPAGMGIFQAAVAGCAVGPTFGLIVELLLKNLRDPALESE